MDHEAAKMYKHDRQMFEQTVKMWVEAFASDYQIDQKIKQLTDMGFDEETSIKTLEMNNWDVSIATNKLLGL